MRSHFVAFFLLLSSPFTYGGEWHSAGNAPPPAYYPGTPANYKCRIVVTTAAGQKAYRILIEHDFVNSEFQEPGSGVASYVIKGESDPGMDGQWIALRFSRNNDGEDLHLSIGVSVKGRASNFSSTQVDRTAGRITGSASLDLGKVRGVCSVSVQADCREFVNSDLK